MLDFDLDNKENWKIGIEWLVENTIKFRDTFSKLMKEKTA